jgi:hypothetical protein
LFEVLYIVFRCKLSIVLQTIDLNCWLMSLLISFFFTKNLYIPITNEFLGMVIQIHVFGHKGRKVCSCVLCKGHFCVCMDGIWALLTCLLDRSSTTWATLPAQRSFGFCFLGFVCLFVCFWSTGVWTQGLTFFGCF